MPLIDDLLTLVEDAGAGTFNVDIFLRNATVPMIYSGSLCITDYEGQDPLWIHNSVLTPAFIRPRAQFMARAATADLAYRKARLAYGAVIGKRNVFINSGWYREIKVLQEPFPLGEDDNREYRFAFNVEAQKGPEVVS